MPPFIFFLFFLFFVRAPHLMLEKIAIPQKLLDYRQASQALATPLGLRFRIYV